MHGSDMKKSRLLQTTTIAAVLLGLSAGLAQPAGAQTIEERLRAELRSTSQQLQRLQSEQAQINAAKAAAESQRDAAQAEVAQLRKALDKAQGQADTFSKAHESLRAQASSQISAAQSQLAQARGAHEQLSAQARQVETQRQALGKQLATRDHELQVCMLKNDQLYGAGKEILSAYESFSTGDLMALRQPFSAGARVAFDMKAQELGDKLYEHKFDRQAVDTPAIAP